MQFQIFQLLQDYQLDDLATIRQRLMAMSQNDWLSFSDSLEKYYESALLPNLSVESINPLTFCLPSIPAQFLPKITSHILLADRVFLDDPLYDIAATVAGFGSTRSPEHKYLLKWARQACLEQAEKQIEFYLRAKELIIEWTHKRKNSHYISMIR
ncbi:hypothetical protein D1AOALGA4SA_3957 [Olavius algarvensis Delta 1 endosymbiont]|nr:hypothetical protein D1AOALGA4SA_3957 [Olavius algarvensis Delta 1 endosymbiont]